MFCWHNKRILLHKYQQNIFVDLTKLFSQCIGKFFVYIIEMKIHITDIFDFYLSWQNQDLMQYCENVI